MTNSGVKRRARSDDRSVRGGGRSVRSGDRKVRRDGGSVRSDDHTVKPRDVIVTVNKAKTNGKYKMSALCF